MSDGRAEEGNDDRAATSHHADAAALGERRDVVCGDPWLSKVTDLQARVEELRSHLRAALKHDSPRMERCVLDATLRLLVSSLYGGDSALHQHMSEYYLQEVLCALLYMMCDTEEGDVADTETPIDRASRHLQQAELQASEHVSPYISATERLLCRDLFLAVVFNGNVPVFHSIQALYPLMIGVAPNRAGEEAPEAISQGSSDRAEGDGFTRSSTSSQNNICDGLFDSPRFRKRRTELSATLNGLILHGTDHVRDFNSSPEINKQCARCLNSSDSRGEDRKAGVYALIRVLVFDDRITQDATMDAALHIAKLLSTPMSGVWMPAADANSTVGNDQSSIHRTCIRRKIDIEEQMKAIDTQLVIISELHAITASAEESVGAGSLPSAVKTVPRYVRQLKQVHTLPLETRSDRLHMVLASVVNSMLKLPVDVPTSAVAHQLAYRRFFYLNKYYLSPAFSSLALRKSCRADGLQVAGQRVEASAARLWTLADGASTGMSSRALLTALELVSGGVVELFCVLPNLRPGCELHRLISALWQTLSIGLPYDAEEIAYALLDGCEGNPLMVHSLWPGEVDSPAAGTAAEHLKIIPYDMELPLTEDTQQSRKQADSANSSRRRRYLALLNLLKRTEKIPCAFVSAVFQTALTRCQQVVYSPDEAPNSVRDASKCTDSQTNEKHSDMEHMKLAFVQRVLGKKQRTVDLSSSPMQHLVEFVEASVLTFDSSELFGDNPSTTTVLEITAKTLTLTAATWHWSVLLLTQLLAAPESCESCTTRLLAALQAVSALLNDDALHAALAIAESGEAPTSEAQSNAATATRLEEFKALRLAAKELVEKRLREAHVALHDAGSKDIPDQKVEDESESAQLPKARAEAQRRKNAAEKTRSEANVHLVVRHVATLCQDVERHLVTRARAPLAVALNSLVGAVEELVIPPAAQCGAPWPYYEVGEQLVNASLRVLAETDDTCAAVLVIRILTTVALRRLDSAKAAFFSRKIVQCLLVEEKTLASKPGVWRSIIPRTLMPPSAGHADRLKLRLLDVVLAVCDYDEDALTLRHLDERTREVYGDRTSFASVLMNLVAGEGGGRGGGSSSRSAAVAVAATHLLGHYAVAVFPRVSLTMLCDFCKTVFRLSPHAMVKAASAAMLETVCQFVYSHNLMTTLGSVELDTLHTIASAMANYYNYNKYEDGNAANPFPATTDETAEQHGEVIRMHGTEVLRLLRELAQRPVIETVTE